MEAAVVRYQGLALLVALIVPVGTSTAAPIVESGTAGYKITIPYGSENKRVGNAVVTKLQWTNGPGEIGTDIVLVSCDGTWYALLDLAWVFMGKEMISFSTDLALEPIEFSQTADSIAVYAGALKKHAAQLCKSAGPEPKNVLLPIAISSAQGGGKPASSALVLGTRPKSTRPVEVWIRTSEFEYKPVLDSSGNPMYVSGKQQFKKVATGNYTLTRSGYDCQNRTVSSYQTVAYRDDASPKEYSLPRDKVEAQAVIPGTVGEANLETICKIYSDLN